MTGGEAQFPYTQDPVTGEVTWFTNQNGPQQTVGDPAGTNPAQLKFVNGANSAILQAAASGGAVVITMPGASGTLITSGGSIPLSSLAAQADGTFVANVSGASAAPTAVSMNILAGEPQGRLTLTAATPVMSATVTGATTIRYTPYLGAIIPLWDGNAMIPVIFTELTNVTTNSSVGNAGPAAVGANSVYDLFVWNNAGVPTLTRGPAWTNATTRSAGTAIGRNAEGFLVNTQPITNGPAANFGTYVGTVYSNVSSTIDFILGGATSGGTAASLGVWNMYNRITLTTAVTDSGSTYTYATATVRQARASAGNQITFLQGLAEDGVDASYAADNTTNAVSGSTTTVGLGLDSTSSFAANILHPLTIAPTANAFRSAPMTRGTFYGLLGQHVIAALETGDGANTNTLNSSSLNTLQAAIRL